MNQRSPVKKGFKMSNQRANRSLGNDTGISERIRQVDLDASSLASDVNLSIRVPRRLRQHWAAEAKRAGTSLTAAITEALSRRFGEP